MRRPMNGRVGKRGLRGGRVAIGASAKWRADFGMPAGGRRRRVIFQLADVFMATGIHTGCGGSMRIVTIHAFEIRVNRINRVAVNISIRVTHSAQRAVIPRPWVNISTDILACRGEQKTGFFFSMTGFAGDIPACVGTALPQKPLLRQTGWSQRGGWNRRHIRGRRGGDQWAFRCRINTDGGGIPTASQHQK